MTLRQSRRWPAGQWLPFRSVLKVDALESSSLCGILECVCDNGTEKVQPEAARLMRLPSMAGTVAMGKGETTRGRQTK